MLGISITILFALLAAYAAWTYALSPAIGKGLKSDNNAVYIILAAAAAFVLRVILAAVYKGHETDMNCFIGWSGAAFEHGISKFYTLDMFHDYPPGYMYVLYVIGALQKLFGFSVVASYVLVKLPAIICDIITGVIIYKIAKKRFSDSISTVLACLYMFNPAAILNCSLWGQVDAVYTLFALLMIYFISEKKMFVSYFMFALCIFIKPQAFIFTPVLIGGIIENVFLDDFNWNKFCKNLGFGVYKRVATEDNGGSITPKIKISENVAKITTPGFKQVHRLYSKKDSSALADVITMHGEKIDDTKPYTIFDPEHTWKRKTITDFYSRELLKPVFVKGECVYDSPDIDVLREYCKMEVDGLWDEVKRFENPHTYYVDLSEDLWKLKHKMLEEYQD